MSEGDPPSFQTTRELVDSNTELQWGGSDGESWTDAIETSTGVTISDSGTVQSSTISDTVIDNFEPVLYSDQDRSLGDVYTGELDQFSRQQSIVYNGNWALEIGNIGINSSGVITDTNDINHLSPGESIEWFSRGESTGGVTRGPIAKLLIAVQSETGKSSVSGYSFGIEYRYNRCTITRHDNGSETKLYIPNNGTTTLPSQKWHRCRVDWGTDGTLRLRVWDESDTLIFDESVSDSTFNSGGIGWNNRGDDRDNTGTAWVDQAQLL